METKPDKAMLPFLEQLLDGAHVEWVELGEVTNYEQPTKYIVESTEYSDTYQTPVLTAGKSFLLGYTNEKKGIYTGSKSPVIIFDDFTTANKWVDFDFKVKSSAMKMITSKDESKVLLRYIYFWLNTVPSGLVEGDHKRQWISNYANKRIPIPCPDQPEKSLAIQQRIVDILDAFTELTAELTARKKQYQYYRDTLLTFDEQEVEWKTLGEVFRMRAGQHIPTRKIADKEKDDFIYPCFGGNGIRGYVQKKSHEGEYLLIGRQGALCGNVQRMRGQFYATEHAVTVAVNEEVNIDWAYHVLTLMNLNKYKSQSAQPGLAVSKLLGLKIPIPPLAEQERIVAILDQFDSLTHSMSKGLPREIELRQKQYQTYREQLLSFPKSAQKI